jgi:SAM-dependent methyltransferase
MLSKVEPTDVVESGPPVLSPTRSMPEAVFNERVQAYGATPIHREMLRDKVRVNAYAQALERLAPGNVVADFGCGTGILSVIAALKGAARVYGMELTPIAELAKELVRQHALEDKVHIVVGDASRMQLPEKVDVLVSEWMGGLAVDENFVPALVQCRDTHLKSGGLMIPARAKGFAALAEDPLLEAGMDCWFTGYHGVDLSYLAHLHSNEVLNARHEICSAQLLATPSTLFDLDMRTANAADADFECQAVCKVVRDGIVSCIAAWFECEMGEGTVLTNAPWAPKTHWGRTAFPIGRPIRAREGQEFVFTLASRGSGLMKAVQTWSIAGDGIDQRSFSGVQVPTHSPGFH